MSLNIFSNVVYWMTLNSSEIKIGAVQAADGGFVFLTKIKATFTNFSHEAYKIIKHESNILFVTV